MGVTRAGGSGSRRGHDRFDYRADLRGRSVDAGALLRLAFGGPVARAAPSGGPGGDELAPELRRVARRSHPF